MWNSLILMFSQYDKNRKIANAFKCIWFIYLSIIIFFNFDLTFLIIEVSSFLLTTIFIRLVNGFVPKANAVLSIFSILIYSFFIDVICYNVLPVWRENQSLSQYIMNGFIFNGKYVFLNIVIFLSVNFCLRYLRNHKIKTHKTLTIASKHF